MKKWSVVIILAMAQFVMVLDSTVMNVSISKIVEDLGTSVTALQSAITFYTLTMAAFMLVGAKLGARWGLVKTFIIGSVVYGAGSLMTGLSQNIQTLMIGWSVIEGLGAVLVIPAIAALVAANYKGRDRVIAFAIIGGISGAAAAAGPLIGGYVTTYLSWRYVFFAETIIMLAILYFSRSFKSTKPNKLERVDIKSAVLSSIGMLLLVFGLLQSKQWGWISPMSIPEIFGYTIAPFGISIVAYLITGGLYLLFRFFIHQAQLEKNNGSPLLQVSMLNIPQLRSGLAVLATQYTITAAIFFVVPIYLQIVLGFNALETGLRILPLSLALISFSIIGSKLSTHYAVRKIVRIGQLLLILGCVSLFVSINIELRGLSFSVAMVLVGAGLGLLASQLSNVNMTAVNKEQTSEVGGLQGSFQNLGSSVGTAIIGSVLIASLTSGFISGVNATDLPSDIKVFVREQSSTGLQIVSSAAISNYAIENGVGDEDAKELAATYRDAQISGLRESLFYLVVISMMSVILSRNLPRTLPAHKD
jgi:MFS family permease